MDKEEAFNEWNEKAESKYQMVGDLSYFNCLRFLISEEEDYLIGLEEDGDSFFITHQNEAQVWSLATSLDVEDLNKWLNIINTIPPIEIGIKSSYFPETYQLQ